jgi:hypothetical protein
MVEGVVHFQNPVSVGFQVLEFLPPQIELSLDLPQVALHHLQVVLQVRIFLVK